MTGLCMDTPGEIKPWRKIQRNYHFDGMKCKVTEFIRNCEQCAKNKPSRHKPYRQAQQMDLPEAPWETITMDFCGQVAKVNRLSNKDGIR